MTPKWRIFLWLDWPLSADLRICFFRKVFKKSDTAGALRRSLTLILWITLVSFINVYYEYFCKITGCFGIKTLLHLTHQCKLRFLDINMHIIEKKTCMYCVTWCPMSVSWWRSLKVSDSFYLYFCFLWLLSLAGKMAVFFWLGGDLT